MKDIINYLTEKVSFPNIQNKITNELYSFTPKTLISTLILSIIFITLFWFKVENNLLLIIWFSLITILNLSRLLDYYRYQKEVQENYLKWHNIFHIKSLLHAILWGVTPILFLLDLNPVNQVILLLMLTGIAGGVIGFILDFKIASIFISILLIPIFTMLFFSTMPYASNLQILIFIYYLLLLTASRHLNQLFYEMYTSKERYHKAKEMLSSKEKKLSALLEQAPIGIFYYDNDLKILRHNTMFKKLFGREEDLNAFDLKQIKDSKAISTLEQVLRTHSEKETIGSFNFSFHNEPIWIELTCSSLLNDNNQLIGGIGTIEDKSDEHSYYEKINYISLHDILTNLPNRRSYQEYMENLIQKVEHTDFYSFLFYMDLNHFKQINDTFGHIVGDKLLLKVSNRLKKIKIKNKYLSRIGGDEFIMLIPFCTKKLSKAQKKAKEIAIEIKNSFNEAFQIEGLELFMTTSIGIVLIEPNSNNTEQIIRQATKPNVRV